MDGENAVSLAQQKFSFDLINVALAEEDDQTRAQRLRFMVEIGLLNNLKAEKIIEYAELEEERIRSGADTLSFIPKTDPVQIQQSSGGSAPPIDLIPIRTGVAVILESAGAQKINVIKEVRALTGLGLRDAKELVETPDSIISTGLVKEQAVAVQRKLEDLGARTRLEVVN